MSAIFKHECRAALLLSCLRLVYAGAFPFVCLAARARWRLSCLCFADLACGRLRAKRLMTGCVGVKIRRGDFATFTRQRSVAPPTHDGRTIAQIAQGLLTRWLTQNKGAKLRLLGVVLTDLSPASQLGLFENAPPHATRLDAALDEARARFGSRALRRANTLK